MACRGSAVQVRLAPSEFPFPKKKMQYFLKLIFLLNPKEKKRLLLLLFSSVIMAILDVVGISSIMPFFAILSNPTIINTNKILNKIYNYFNFSTNDEFLLFAAIFAFITIIISLIFKTFNTYALNKYTRLANARVSSSLLKIYFDKPFSWYATVHRPDLITNLISIVGDVISGGLRSILIIATQGILSFAILVTLFIANSNIAIILGITFSVIYLIIIFFTSNILNRLGKERVKANQEMISKLNEIFSVYKSIKIANLENIYSKKYEIPLYKNAKVFTFIDVLSILPKFFIEAITIGIILLLIIFSLSNNSESFSEIIPILSLYAFAIYRLMPSLQMLYNGINSFKFSWPSIDLIYSEFKSSRKNNPSKYKIRRKFSDFQKITFKKNILLKNIHFQYPGSDYKALKGINLDIKKNTIIGLVGETGSGKSTTIDIISRLLIFQKGTFEIDGKDISSVDIKSWQNSIGYVPQQIYLNSSSIMENIAFGVEFKNINMKLIERASKIANLHNDVINDMPERYQTKVGDLGIKLSGGQCQRVAIARALYHRPEVLIFDEATSSLDNLTEEAVMNSIINLKNKMTIILVAHKLSTIKKCDNIYLFRNGKIVDEGNYRDLKSRNKLFQRMLKIEQN